MDVSVRRASDGEVSFFDEHGWVRLPRLVTPETADRLRERAAGRLRSRDRQRRTLVDQAFGQSRDIAAADELFGALALSPAMGRNAARMLRGVRAVRVQVTNLLVKEPGEHGATQFHQDFPWMPMDRSAMLTVWLALADVPADMGSLRFYSGSHRHGCSGAASPGRATTSSAATPGSRSWSCRRRSTSGRATRPRTTHSHSASRGGLEQQRLLASLGVDLGRLVLGHDSYCFNDRFDEAVVRRRHPNYHLLHISRDVLPELRERGVTEDQIHQMLVDNPRRIFG